MGKKIFVQVKRYSCRECGHWHRVIPDNIIPYKHYRKDIYQKAVNGQIEDDLRFEDYPSDITKQRWRY